MVGQDLMHYFGLWFANFPLEWSFSKGILLRTTTYKTGSRWHYSSAWPFARCLHTISLSSPTLGTLRHPWGTLAPNRAQYNSRWSESLILQMLKSRLRERQLFEVIYIIGFCLSWLKKKSLWFRCAVLDYIHSTSDLRAIIWEDHFSAINTFSSPILKQHFLHIGPGLSNTAPNHRYWNSKFIAGDISEREPHDNLTWGLVTFGLGLGDNKHQIGNHFKIRHGIDSAHNSFCILGVCVLLVLWFSWPYIERVIFISQ